MRLHREDARTGPNRWRKDGRSRRKDTHGYRIKARRLADQNQMQNGLRFLSPIILPSQPQANGLSKKARNTTEAL
jgi:hypothetical protein